MSDARYVTVHVKLHSSGEILSVELPILPDLTDKEIQERIIVALTTSYYGGDGPSPGPCMGGCIPEPNLRALLTKALELVG